MNETFLVIGTWALVAVTFYMTWRQSKVSKDDLKIRLELNFIDRFDSPTIKEARKNLAKQLLSHASHYDIKEDVMNFFEDLGLLLKEKRLDEKLFWGNFSFYAIRWWIATKDYITEERKKYNNDTSLFSDFEYLAGKIYKMEIKELGKSSAELQPDSEEILIFLKDEANFQILKY